MGSNNIELGGSMSGSYSNNIKIVNNILAVIAIIYAISRLVAGQLSFGMYAVQTKYTRADNPVEYWLIVGGCLVFGAYILLGNLKKKPPKKSDN